MNENIQSQIFKREVYLKLKEKISYLQIYFRRGTCFVEWPLYKIRPIKYTNNPTLYSKGCPMTKDETWSFWQRGILSPENTPISPARRSHTLLWASIVCLAANNAWYSRSKDNKVHMLKFGNVSPADGSPPTRADRPRQAGFSTCLGKWYREGCTHEWRVS